MAAAILKQQQTQLDHHQVEVVDDSTSEAESSANSLRGRRRGRPPKNSNLDLSYSPPEKRARTSPDR